MGFKVANLGLERRSVTRRDVWRVGDNDVQFRTRVVLKPAHTVGNAVTAAITLDNRASPWGNIKRPHVGLRVMRGKGNGDSTRSGANVRNSDGKKDVLCGYGLSRKPAEDAFNEELGFRARDKNVRSDLKGKTVELLLAGQVLQRFVGGAALDEALKTGMLFA